MRSMECTQNTPMKKMNKTVPIILTNKITQKTWNFDIFWKSDYFYTNYKYRLLSLTFALNS
jgi:hypothetical protein